MNCPKCFSPMEKVAYAAIEVDRCTNCKGVWFDALELDELRKMPGSEAVDTGVAQIGAEYNKLDRLACPKCGGGVMLRMVEPHQPHIRFEQCKVCGGTFLDAGEFRDLKEETLGDFFRALRVRKRP